VLDGLPDVFVIRLVPDEVAEEEGEDGLEDGQHLAGSLRPGIVSDDLRNLNLSFNFNFFLDSQKSYFGFCKTAASNWIVFIKHLHY
jgi:hypothetical protein